MITGALIADDGSVKASVNGPAIIPVPQQIIVKAKSQYSLLASPSLQIPKITNASFRPNNLLKRLIGGQRRKLKSTMSVAGTHVVEIEGPMSILQARIHDAPNKYYLVPFMTSTSTEQTQEYALIPKQQYKSIASKSLGLKAFNDRLKFERSSSTLTARLFDLSKYQ
jgi:hypothetical protein